MKNLDGWTDDGMDDGTDGWKGGPAASSATTGQNHGYYYVGDKIPVIET
jgi:hypothetical protein